MHVPLAQVLQFMLAFARAQQFYSVLDVVPDAIGVLEDREVARLRIVSRHACNLADMVVGLQGRVRIMSSVRFGVSAVRASLPLHSDGRDVDDDSDLDVDDADPFRQPLKRYCCHMHSDGARVTVLGGLQKLMIPERPGNRVYEMDLGDPTSWILRSTSGDVGIIPPFRLGLCTDMDLGPDLGGVCACCFANAPWDGSENVPIDLSLDVVFVYSYASHTWRTIRPLANAPPQRSSGVVAAVGSVLYLFGGVVGRVVLGDFWSVDLSEDSPSWCKESLAGEKLPPRNYPSACPVGKSIYFFGGCSQVKISTQNMMFRYDTVGSWALPPQVGRKPCRRASQSMTAIGAHIFMGGGVRVRVSCNDLWHYDTTVNQWNEIILGSVRTNIFPRGFFGFAAGSKALYIFGGATKEKGGGELPSKLRADFIKLDLEIVPQLNKPRWSCALEPPLRPSEIGTAFQRALMLQLRESAGDRSADAEDRSSEVRVTAMERNLECTKGNLTYKRFRWELLDHRYELV